MLKSSGGLFVLVFLLMVVTLSVFLVGGGLKSTISPTIIPTATPEEVLVTTRDATKESSLTLNSIPFTTLTPSPSPTPTAEPTKSCEIEGVKNSCSCPNMKNFPNIPTDECSLAKGCELLDICNACQPAGEGTCMGNYRGINGPWMCTNIKKNLADGLTHCIDKPIIYLYPTVETSVNVTLHIPGPLTISIPLYNNGWENVMAQPNGTLTYNDKTYRELYYESAVKEVRPPQNGIVIPTTHIKESLFSITAQLGLTPFEQNEFASYWTSRLESTQSPYIFFSLLNPDEKERIDHVEISPKPDTWIAFIAYFKPIATPFTSKPLLILPPKPERHGFTAVEWGGTLDN